MADLAWGMLIHLSMNMWTDRRQIDEGEYLTPTERFPFATTLGEMLDDATYESVTQRLSDVGATMVVLDLGDAISYDSHPEIAVEGAWSRKRLAEELVRLRDLGLEPIPKLNFSSSHDAWMHGWSRQLSTPAYYQTCRDLIAEMAEAFDGPRYFHVGMDEEQAEHQITYDYTVVRQGDLWWHDLGVYLDAVRAVGARPWMWSDAAWENPGFLSRVDRDVIQSNWYYDVNFDVTRSDEPKVIGYDDAATTYLDLAAVGLDQIPTGANWRYDTNLAETVRFCAERIDPAGILGFLQTTWKPTRSPYAGRLNGAVDQLGEARSLWEQLRAGGSGS